MKEINKDYLSQDASLEYELRGEKESIPRKSEIMLAGFLGPEANVIHRIVDNKPVRITVRMAEGYTNDNEVLILREETSRKLGKELLLMRQPLGPDPNTTGIRIKNGQLETTSTIGGTDRHAGDFIKRFIDDFCGVRHTTYLLPPIEPYIEEGGDKNARTRNSYKK